MTNEPLWCQMCGRTLPDSEDVVFRKCDFCRAVVLRSQQSRPPTSRPQYPEIPQIEAALLARNAEIKALQARVDGYHLIDRFPSLGDWVLVRFVPGFIQPYKVVQYLEDKWGNRRFGPHMDRQIDRWWPLPEERNE